MNEFEELIKQAQQEVMWGTFGKGGAEHCRGTCPEHQLRWVRIEDCDTEHLQMILKNQRHIYETYTGYVTIIHEILKDRGVKPEKFSPVAEAEFWNAVNKARFR